MLEALGAQVVRTPIGSGSYDLDGLMAKAQLLSKEIPNSVVLDQVCLYESYSILFYLKI